jgi:hypothetical protein
MDQVPVVSERKFDGGEKLIQALVGAGVPLAGACWAKTPRYARPRLFLVTPSVEGVDARPTYRKVGAAIDDLDAAKAWQHWLERVDQFDVMLVGPGTDMGRALAWEYQHYPGPGPTIQYGWLGASIPLEEGAAYIYPPESFRPHAASAAG